MEPDSPDAPSLKPAAFHILLSLVHGEQHGYAIMQQVAERTKDKLRLWPATLYGTIKQLLQDGLIEEALDRKADDDPRRRYYRLTPQGRQVLAAERERLEELVRLLNEGMAGARV